MQLHSEGGKRGKAPAEARSQEKGGFGTRPAVFKGNPNDKTKQQTADDIDQEGAQIQLIFTGIKMGTDQIAQNASHASAQENKECLFHGVPID